MSESLALFDPTCVYMLFECFSVITSFLNVLKEIFVIEL